MLLLVLSSVGCARSTPAEPAQVALDFVGALVAGDTRAAASMSSVDSAAIRTWSSNLQRWAADRSPRMTVEDVQSIPRGSNVAVRIDTDSSTALMGVLIDRDGRVTDMSGASGP